MIKFLDLKSQYSFINEEINTSILEVIENESFILGKYVDRFEQNISNYIGVDKDCSITCASGSDALLLALMAIGIKEDDEVITTPFSFIATASCISRIGAKIVFVDVNDEFNIDVNLIESKISKNTKAIISVDLYGKPCDQIAIKNICKKYNLFYISDSSQSIGSSINSKKIGTIADFTTFSFFPSKNLGCYGDGGMIISLDKNYAEKIKRLRTHGSSKDNKYFYELVGINSRLDAMQANILNVKLKYLDLWIDKRINNAINYRNNIYINNQQSHCGHVYNQYTILSHNRDNFKKYLEKNKIPTMIYYPTPLHVQKCFKYLKYNTGDFPKAELYSNNVISIPIHENLNDLELNYIIKTINDYKSI